MNIEQFKDLLNDKRVVDEINNHLWIESQKFGYSIGVERATDEWVSQHALAWMKYNEPARYEKLVNKKRK